MSRRRKLLIALATIALMGSGAVVWFLQSGWINRYVIERAQAEVEKLTGAKLELGQVRIDPWRGKATIDGVVLHGKEAAGEQPLFTAREVTIDARISSFSRDKIDLRGLTLKEPRFRLITYSDGTTNLPGPKMATASTKTALETFADLRLGHLDVEKGEFSWNERKTPFSLSAKDFLARVDYLPASRSYRGKVESAKLKFEREGGAVIEGKSNLDFAIDKEKITIEKATLETPLGTALTARGEIRNLQSQERPLQVALDIEGMIGMRQIHPFLKLPVESSGSVLYTGRLLYEPDRGLELHGDARARDIFYHDESTRIGPLTARSHVDWLPGRLTLTAMRAEGL